MFKSKVVSVILVLVLFFGTAINVFAEGDTVGSGYEILAGVGIVLGVILVGTLVWYMFLKAPAEDFLDDFNVDASPDDGIKMVSTEGETSSVEKDDKTILNVLQHVEAGVTPNKDIYVGLRFQY